eukprot:g1894.t1
MKEDAALRMRQVRREHRDKMQLAAAVHEEERQRHNQEVLTLQKQLQHQRDREMSRRTAVHVLTDTIGVGMSGAIEARLKRVYENRKNQAHDNDDIIELLARHDGRWLLHRNKRGDTVLDVAERNGKLHLLGISSDASEFKARMSAADAEYNFESNSEREKIKIRKDENEDSKDADEEKDGQQEQRNDEDDGEEDEKEEEIFIVTGNNDDTIDLSKLGLNDLEASLPSNPSLMNPDDRYYLDSEWEIAFDEETERHYYFNHITGKSQWSLPDGYAPQG